MAGVRSLARRVQRLERGRDRQSPIVVMYGTFDAFERDCEALMISGALDREFRVVVAGLRDWEESGVWDETLRDHAFVRRPI